MNEISRSQLNEAREKIVFSKKEALKSLIVFLPLATLSFLSFFGVIGIHGFFLVILVLGMIFFGIVFSALLYKYKTRVKEYNSMQADLEYQNTDDYKIRKQKEFQKAIDAQKRAEEAEIEKKNNNIKSFRSEVESQRDSQNYLYIYKKEEYLKQDSLDFIREGIQNRSINYDNIDVEIIDYVSELTLIETDNILIENDMKNYGVVEISRTTNVNIDADTYFYVLENDGTFKLMKAPFVNDQVQIGDKLYHYIAFDKTKYEEAIKSKVVIDSKQIRDYTVFGTELMETSISISKTQEHMGNNVDDLKSDSINKVSISGAFFSELFFGQSYTMLKGVNNMVKGITDKLVEGNNRIVNSIKDSFTALNETLSSLSSNHRIVDTRLIQVIFDDSTDIELVGVSIIYEFNRKIGSKRRNETKKVIEQPVHLKEHKNSYIEELKQLKELLDAGIISEEEFNAKKTKLLDL
ncbi:SHOCT domain-containing protein [Candidatus Xianfuyuplasma coldseepsis]|nr:SHOCT domain-containing protein [Xianfuyuplasma coldseepsis]